MAVLAIDLKKLDWLPKIQMAMGDVDH